MYLQCDRPGQIRVVCQVHLAHTAGTEARLDPETGENLSWSQR